MVSKLKLLRGTVGLSLAASMAALMAAPSQALEPLLMEGKTTLYQRVLTTPSCRLNPPAAPYGTQAGVAVPAFSQYYVYREEDQGNGQVILSVGPDATGKITGKLDAACTVPWKQQLALLFTNSAQRYRALIFDEETALDAIIDNDDGAERYRTLYDQVMAGNQAEHVISIEPEEYVDYQQNFYLLPILNSVESMFPDGSYVYKHEIASITAPDAQNVTAAHAGDQAASAQPASASAAAASASAAAPASATVATGDGATAGKGAAAGAEPALVGFKSAVVFVIDSSISMQPYIDRTKKAINAIYKSIEASNLGSSVNFGIVSFRANVRKVPGLEYTAKMYLRPGEATDAKTFNQKVAALEQATVSSAQFDEDAYAGINLALQDINWNEYGGRYIVLITDAGAIDGNDAQSTTGLDANALRLEAEHYGAAIYTLHLLTASGKRHNNHDHAREQYELLSYNSILGKPLYYPVNAGSVESFGSMVDTLARSLTAQVQLASSGQMAAGSSLSATAPKTQEESLVVDSNALGLAMQLAYLGRVQGTKSPDFLQGWISERDVVDHNKVVCTPIVLVNRNQLSDLYTLVKGVLESGIAGQLSSDAMFAQLQALAAQMGRDPNQLSKSSTIAQMGIMGELLDDLPYKSRIASYSPEDWYNLGSQEQDNIVRSLENSLNYLQHCSSDNDRFIKLNVDADASDEVYPIPLDALP